MSHNYRDMRQGNVRNSIEEKEYDQIMKYVTNRILLLDIGAGKGTFIRRFASIFKNVIVVDGSIEVINQAKKYLQIYLIYNMFIALLKNMNPLKKQM